MAFTENNLRNLMQQAKNEIQDFKIQTLVNDFTPMLNEFEGYIENVDINKAFRKILNDFIYFLRDTYKIEKQNILVNSSAYNVPNWGALYWSFLHYSSILLQHAVYNKLTTTLKKFPVILYNIDRMLPCGICIKHYLKIKHTEQVLIRLKMLSFGFIIESVYSFHHMITANIHRIDHPNEKYNAFTSFDFIEKYNLFPLYLNNIKVTTEFVFLNLNVQTPLHFNLSKLLFIYYQTTYISASNKLKTIYGLESNNLDRTNMELFERLDNTEIVNQLLLLINRQSEPNYPKDENRAIFADIYEHALNHVIASIPNK